jgi:hypothetical protein
MDLCPISIFLTPGEVLVSGMDTWPRDPSPTPPIVMIVIVVIVAKALYFNS